MAFNPKQDLSVSSTKMSMEGCVAEVGKWMSSNKLKQNDDKTELKVFMPPWSRNTLFSISVGEAVVSASQSA